MNTHPDSIQLDALALGSPDAEAVASSARTHVAVCAECMRYVASLQKELSSAEPLPRLRALPIAPAPIFWLRRAAFAAAPVLAVAAGILLYVHTQVSMPDAIVPAPAHATVAEARFKGGLPMAVVLERDSVQSRHTDRVLVRPGDRLRIEVALDVARPTTAGVLDESGAFVTALAPALLEPGTHYSDLSIRIDDHPKAGWVLAGVPAAVERARETHDFADVAAIPMQVQAP